MSRLRSRAKRSGLGCQVRTRPPPSAGHRPGDLALAAAAHRLKGSALAVQAEIGA
jgi:hypothetical protein